MLVAVVADVHGDSSALEKALDQARLLGFDHLVSLGDLVDYLNPDPEAQGVPLEQVVRWDRRLLELTAGGVRIRGNQEERADSFLGEMRLPVDLRSALNGPTTVNRWGYTFGHGHRYSGESVSEDRWVPLGAQFSSNVLIHGHHHRNSVVKLGTTRDWPSATDVALTSGKAVPLDPGERYLINVGATQGSLPSWGLLDTEANTYTPYFTEIRFHRAKRQG